VRLNWFAEPVAARAALLCFHLTDHEQSYRQLRAAILGLRGSPTIFCRQNTGVLRPNPAEGKPAADIPRRLSENQRSEHTIFSDEAEVFDLDDESGHDFGMGMSLDKLLSGN